MSSQTSGLLAKLGMLRGLGLGAPLLLLSILAMMVVPLSPVVLDLAFTFNIALSIVILLSVVNVMRPLDFSAFPTVLLMATLLRLALNVGSSRVVLLHGHQGPHAAGQVIESFGEFVVGGSFAVGIVVFVILTIVNFMVVTKGAERVSEVSARFILDALPGRQMAIDADMNAGLLTREEAKARRDEVREEADFYGSMDGASKFIRGDAIAGILILFINIVGGLFIGTMEHGLDLATAGRNYTLLTIGDGLVAQVPSLLMSVAVAVLVTRMSRAQDIAGTVMKQVFAQPKVLGVASGVLGLVGLIPGMPNLVFLLLSGACGGGAWLLARRAARPPAEPVETPKSDKPAELSWDDVQPEDPLGLEVGYRLIPLVDPRQGGELMPRIKGIRRKLTQELGFLVPPVHIRDNLELPPNGYRITLLGVPLASGQIHADRELALNPGRVFGTLEGIATKDPTFGMEAVWVERGRREHAQSLGYTVVDAATVIATHLSHLVGEHIAELFGFDEAQQLLNGLAKSSPKLVEDLVPKAMPLAIFVKVLQGLLAERVSIRNLRVIAEALAEAAPRSQDPVVLTGAARVALSRQIVQEINGLDEELQVLTLAAPLEQVLQNSVATGNAALEPGLAERMHTSLVTHAQKQESSGRVPVLLVPQALRPILSRFTRQTIPALRVLAYNEIPESRRVRIAGAVGA
ncbi:flagellar biosynthesis protein FlhA [Panacagrimonas perspica]|uniref:Flagellar biosynthesis protein FlhA n=1 Tax=Panacagrimonas perspica TaxID=381431 RepID=A0A4S3K433_9GAMM|nr:flagellar biosynthesis protein FlhA [Panacagrimonas perspica]TDU25808.1 flagellar biosynthesis protein FlhA [Panacagrimonas perspica]THD02822.1 flagellar biosynthesis protein FlhA [Panacagrimonas perspica]